MSEPVELRTRMARLEAQVRRLVVWNKLLVVLLILAPVYHGLLTPLVTEWIVPLVYRSPERIKYLAGPRYEFVLLLAGFVIVTLTIAAILIFRDKRDESPR
jgi:hypothetical protein